MTVTAVASLKGSPGVTTLACLLGATWVEPDRVVVAECDPSGGDLAARFGLTSRLGWSTLAASVRRQGHGGPLADHLQELPGGLRVLVGSADSAAETTNLAGGFSAGGSGFSDGPWDLIVDLGRLLARAPAQTPWIVTADRLVVVCRNDAAGIVHVKEWVDAQSDSILGRTHLVTVGPTVHPAEEVEAFTALPVAGRLPYDRAAARTVCGEMVPSLLRTATSRRRIRRAPLVAAAASIATTIAGCGAVLEHDDSGRPSSIERASSCERGQRTDRELGDLPGTDRPRSPQRRVPPNASDNGWMPRLDGIRRRIR